MQRNRIQYIDCAKGILILLLLYGHTCPLCGMEGLWDGVLRRIVPTITWYNCFFMNSFFFITGFCSGFDVGFKKFAWKNVLHLLIPSVILCIIASYFRMIVFNHSVSFAPFWGLWKWLDMGAPWFIISLFLAKLVCWFVLRLKFGISLLVLTILYLSGLLLHRFGVHNILYHQHALMMLPYLWAGVICRRHQAIFDSLLGYAALLGAMAIAAVHIVACIGQYRVPTHDLYIIVSLKTFPIHLITAFGGTALVLWLSKKIKYGGFLKTIGGGSILCYLWNEIVYRSILKIMMPLYSQTPPLRLVMFHGCAYFICIVIFYYLIKLVYGTKMLSWMVGRYRH